MNQLLTNHIKNLKSTLLALNATGEAGFEGLIAAALREITGVPFRLASSGLQFGLDGKPAFELDCIYFEAKRYEGKLPRTEVITKIADLGRNKSLPDLVWVLGATTAVNTQIVDDLCADGSKNGISVLILDWSKTDLPSLAVAIVMGGGRVEAFLKSHISSNLQATLLALAYIRTHPGFNDIAARIKAELDAPAMATALAREANTNWLTEGFNNRKRAINRFGQPLSPGDSSAIKILFRKQLTDELQLLLTHPPKGTVAFILGGEGCGKSWIIAQSWLNLKLKPLLIIFSPDELQDPAAQNDIQSLLICKIIAQIGDKRTESNLKRWERRFSCWQANTDVVPRLVVVMDGINQRPNADWGRIIDKTSEFIEQIGGQLIVTVRTPYFRDYVARRLSSQGIEINVPEWLPNERDEILRNYQINPNILQVKVAQALLNPRLLGIAVGLIDKEDINAWGELSVPRLLFEHIRKSELDAPILQPVSEFVGRLRKHAQGILARLQDNQVNDLTIFEADNKAVADGRFFHPVAGDPGKYQLKDEGLTLALGLSVIEHLLAAKRNNRELGEALNALLEPIAALDSTAEVVLTALNVTVIDDTQYMPEIASALVKGFASLQNPDETRFSEFLGSTKSKPLAFMNAACDLCLEGGHQPNFDWIKSGVIEASKNTRVWAEIAQVIRDWLSVYSISPELELFSHSNSLEKSQRALEDKLNALSPAERDILKRLQKKEGDLNALSSLAFAVLAGKPLESFAECFLNWSFSTALNSHYSAPHKVLMHLVRLNRRDWKATRYALLEASKMLRGDNISRSGQWALVTILQSTGGASDAAEAETLAAELTKDREHFPGWRQIESYCATDPCDPASTEPENITDTAKQYKHINVSELRGVMGQTSGDLFFNDARPGMARFKPNEAAAKHLEFLENALTRTGEPLRLALFELRKHDVLLTSMHAHVLIAFRNELKSKIAVENFGKDNWRVSQYLLLLLAFPLLNNLERIECLLSLDEDEPISHELIDGMKPLDISAFEQLFFDECIQQDAYKQFVLLAIAKSTNTPLSERTRKYVGSLVNSNSDLLRAEAFGIIAQSDQSELLAKVAQSSWNANNVKNDDKLEAWYGSRALLKAAKMELINHLEALDRISPSLYGWAAQMLNIEAQQEIGHRIHASIHTLVGLDNHLAPLDIEIRIQPDHSHDPNLFSLNDKPLPIDKTEFFQKLNESNQELQKRQTRNYELFIEFKNTLTWSKAHIILDGLKLNEFSAIVLANEQIANEWCSLFLELPSNKFSVVHNLILLLAHALSEKAPEKAKALFNKVRDNKPMIRFTFGSVGLELDTMATWAGGKSAVLDEQRLIRLDSAETDHHLFLEVLAGLLNGQQEFLTKYVNEKLSREEPAEIARGIIVTGFSDISEFNEEVLSRFENSAGLIGAAYKAAKYAYDLNCWARHWYQGMCEAKEPIDFWRGAILFNKIVDGRFAIWRDEYPQTGHLITTYGLSFGDNLKNRHDRWKTHREKKLFGNDAPDKIFLYDIEYQ